MKSLTLVLLSFALATIARADYAQIVCTSDNLNGQPYILLLDVNTARQPIWPDRVTLIHGRTLLFTAVDIFDDYFHKPAIAGEHRYVAKNYNDERFRHYQVAFFLNTNQQRSFGEDPFPNLLEFSGRRGIILEVPMLCRWQHYSKPVRR